MKNSKKNILFLNILFLLIQCGEPTDQGVAVEYDYTIANNTGQKLTLFLYKDGHRDLSSKKILDIGQKFNKKYRDCAPYDGFTMLTVFNSTESGNITDVEIIYNNEKRTIYNKCSDIFCPSGVKNIFSIDYNNDFIEIFELTENDYQIAQNCSGACL